MKSEKLTLDQFASRVDMDATAKAYAEALGASNMLMSEILYGDRKPMPAWRWAIVRRWREVCSRLDLAWRALKGERFDDGW